MTTTATTAPQARRLDAQTLQERLASRHRDEDVVLVCRSGALAAQAEAALAGVGLPGLRVLDGGMVAWESSGAPVNRGRETWELERQVRLVAALSDEAGA